MRQEPTIGDQIVYFANDKESLVEGTKGMWLPATIEQTAKHGRDWYIWAIPDHRICGLLDGVNLVPLPNVPVFLEKWSSELDLAGSTNQVILSEDPNVRGRQIERSSTPQLINAVQSFIERHNIAGYKWPSVHYKKFHTPAQRRRLIQWLSKNLLTELGEYGVSELQVLVRKGLLVADSQEKLIAVESIVNDGEEKR